MGSRPLLPLIFSSRQYFNQYINQLAETQPPESHPRLKQAVEKLMGGVSRGVVLPFNPKVVNVFVPAKDSVPLTEDRTLAVQFSGAALSSFNRLSRRFSNLCFAWKFS